MPRAIRYFLPGHVWRITHRCHEREFLLKFARDRARYLRWLFEARKRNGLRKDKPIDPQSASDLRIANGGVISYK